MDNQYAPARPKQRLKHHKKPSTSSNQRGETLTVYLYTDSSPNEITTYGQRHIHEVSYDPTRISMWSLPRILQSAHVILPTKSGVLQIQNHSQPYFHQWPSSQPCTTHGIFLLVHSRCRITMHAADTVDSARWSQSRAQPPRRWLAVVYAGWHRRAYVKRSRGRMGCG